MILFIPYIQYTHHYTVSLSFIVLSIQSKIVGKSEVRAVFPHLKLIFEKFDSFHIFHALISILHPYHSSLCQFNQTFLVTARQYQVFFLIEYIFCTI